MTSKTISIEVGARIVIGANFEDVDFTEDDGNLLIEFGDGNELLLLGFVAATESPDHPVSLIFANGIVVLGDDLLTHLREFEQIDADALPPGGGGSEYKEPSGDDGIIDGLKGRPLEPADLSDLIDYDSALMPSFPKPGDPAPPQPIQRETELLPDLIITVPDPVIPDPVVPDPIIPDPVIPDPVIPDPVIPDPIVPDPVIPDPVVPDPVVPDPVAPPTGIYYSWQSIPGRFYIELPEDDEIIGGAVMTIQGQEIQAVLDPDDGRYYFDFSAYGDGDTIDRETITFTVYNDGGSRSEEYNVVISSRYFRADAVEDGGTDESTSQMILLRNDAGVFTGRQGDENKPDIVFVSTVAEGKGEVWIMPTLGSKIIGIKDQWTLLSFDTADVKGLRVEARLSDGEWTTFYFYDDADELAGTIEGSYINGFSTGRIEGNIMHGDSADNLLPLYPAWVPATSFDEGTFAYGHDGDDEFHAGSGFSTFDGGAGMDLYNAREAELFNKAARLEIDLRDKDPDGWVEVTNTNRKTGEVIWEDRIRNVENIIGTRGQDLIDGDENKNVLVGDKSSDTLNGHGGDDCLEGGLGADVLNGGAGDDVLIGGDGPDTIDGGAGSDILTGGLGGDTFVFTVSDNQSGEREVDYITDYNRTDVDVIDLSDLIVDGIDLSNIVDYIQYDIATNTLSVDADGRGPGAAKIIVTINYTSAEGAFNLIIDGLNVDVVTIIGTAGIDHIDGTIDVVDMNIIDGGAGDDWIIAGEGSDIVLGGAGNDYLFGGSGHVQFRTDGNDWLFGGADDDHLLGGTGADKIDGGAGSDTAAFYQADAGVIVDLINGGSGGEAKGDIYISIENITGSEYADILIGDDGRNFIIGKDGDDKIYGNAGNDILIGQGGADIIYGGDGNDRINGGNSFTADSNDILYGEGGNDTMSGDDGADILNGGDGADILNGGDGADILNGGAGSDTLTGGLGGDTFVFTENTACDNQSGNREADYITDYNRSEGDVIDLSDLVDDFFDVTMTKFPSGTISLYFDEDKDGIDPCDHIVSIINPNAADNDPLLNIIYDIGALPTFVNDVPDWFSAQFPE